jgi:hypothetical protein
MSEGAPAAEHPNARFRGRPARGVLGAPGTVFRRRGPRCALRSGRRIAVTGFRCGHCEYFQATSHGVRGTRASHPNGGGDFLVVTECSRYARRCC